MQQIEALQETIKQLTGAVNAQIEQIRNLELRMSQLEISRINNPKNEQVTSLATPKTEKDLQDISRLPDSVKELQPFDGNPVQYISWIHSVEGILKDYEIVRNKPIYRAILQCIRQKVRGKADSALISYNIFDDDWEAIKKCLSLHYADKRDLRTLEHQLSNLTQKDLSIDEFYANVNHQFSLIVNKIKTETYSHDTMNVLIETYRNRALDVFIRGLNGELSKILTIQRPQTLPEAYASCLEIQNLNYRNLTLHSKNFNNSVTAPINQIFSGRNEQVGIRKTPILKPLSSNIPTQQKNLAYNIQHNSNNKPPARPTQPKPPVPMDIDKSIQTRQVNYMNRPAQSSPVSLKRENTTEEQARKQQRIYHIETEQDENGYSDYIQHYSDYEEDEALMEENPEVNFMTGASLAYHT